MTTKQDWLLIALAHRGGQALSPVQIQKTMFLMAKEAPHLAGGNFYQFVPYNYGPFDANVYHDLDQLERLNYVSSAPTPGRTWKTYSVTAAGLAAAGAAIPNANADGVEYLRRVVDWVSTMSFTQLVRAIYAKYPEFKANSVFTG